MVNFVPPPGNTTISLSGSWRSFVPVSSTCNRSTLSTTSDPAKSPFVECIDAFHCRTDQRAALNTLTRCPSGATTTLPSMSLSPGEAAANCSEKRQLPRFRRSASTGAEITRGRHVALSGTGANSKERQMRPPWITTGTGAVCHPSSSVNRPSSRPVGVVQCFQPAGEAKPRRLALPRRAWGADAGVAPESGAVRRVPRGAAQGQSERSSVMMLEESMILMSLAAACRMER